MKTIDLVSPDTVCALSTAPGVGAIALIRMSGRDALPIADKIFLGRRPSSAAPRSALFGRIMQQGELLDEVILTTYRGPHSFTGEDLVEISCHGSDYIREQLLRLLLACGCRLAEPGEFTKRAFLNGRMDLMKAEAVADLIAARSAAAHRMAMAQLGGKYSQKLNAIADELIRFASLTELELDFSEEDVSFADRSELLHLCRGVSEDIRKLVDSYALGNAIKKGVPVAIVGSVNVGKSTLLNTLIGRERAIVSDIAGTTRDTIEEYFNISGVEFRFIDTAGIRCTDDCIEALGIDRTFRQIEQASVVLYLLDATRPDREQEARWQEIRSRVNDKTLIVLVNKIDLLSCEDAFSAASVSPVPGNYPAIAISAKSGAGIETLKNELSRIARQGEDPEIVVSNTRHYDALCRALAATERIAAALTENIPTDFLSHDLRDAVDAIEEITGRTITSETILHNIFANFCIGK